MSDMEQLQAAIAKVRKANIAGSVAIEAVCMAGDLLVIMMDEMPTVEWCDTHHRPHEFCTLVESAGCDPKVRVLGPEVALAHRAG